jgi:hypothetical protein
MIPIASSGDVKLLSILAQFVEFSRPAIVLQAVPTHHISVFSLAFRKS